MSTIIGIAITAVVAPTLLKLIEWVIARGRDQAETRAVEQATDRDDVKMLLTEWKELHAARIATAQSRHANQLEDWLRRIRGCVNDDPACRQIVAEVAAEVARLRLEYLEN